MPARCERLHASGWRRSFDGSAVPPGGLDAVIASRAGGAGRVLVLGGDLDAWLPGLARAGIASVGMHPSRVALAALRERLPGPLLEEGRIGLLHGDMRDFEPVEGCHGAAVPSPAMAAFGTDQERRDTIACLAATLPAGSPLWVWLEAVPEDLMPADEPRALAESEAFDDPLSDAVLRRRTEVSLEPGRRRVLVRHSWTDAAGEEAGCDGDLLDEVVPGSLCDIVAEAGFLDVDLAREGPVAVLAAVRG